MSSKRVGQKGFTLVELIVVLLILGILAATIAPKFFDFSSSARQSAVKSLAASLSSAAQLAHAVQVTGGFTPGATVTLEGVAVVLALGYPSVTTIASAATFDTALFSQTTVTSSVYSYVIPGATTPASCAASYAVPTSAGNAPQVVYTVSGCN